MATSIPSARFHRQTQIFSIGIYRGPTPLELHPARDVLNPVLTSRQVKDIRASFVADPFLLWQRGSWHMFFEAGDTVKNRGVIALATSQDSRVWTYQQVVLTEPFHLSYPYVFEHQECCYMVPETKQAGAVRLYQADPFPHRWKLAGILINVPLADCSLVQFQGRWWLFGLHENQKLRLFHSPELFGPWVEHRLSPVMQGRPDRMRPAGRTIPWRSGLLRYAQDCQTAYGLRVWPSLVTLSEEAYCEELLGDTVLGPGAERWNRDGMHHIDPHQLPNGEWLACVDGWFMQHQNLVQMAVESAKLRYLRRRSPQK
jgi:hypothetical protein